MYRNHYTHARAHTQMDTELRDNAGENALLLCDGRTRVFYACSPDPTYERERAQLFAKIIAHCAPVTYSCTNHMFAMHSWRTNRPTDRPESTPPPKPPAPGMPMDGHTMVVRAIEIRCPNNELPFAATVLSSLDSLINGDGRQICVCVFGHRAVSFVSHGRHFHAVLPNYLISR